MNEGPTGQLYEQTRVRKYVLTGTTSEVVAMNYAATNIPYFLTAESLYRQDITQSSPGHDVWYFDVSYGPIPRGIGEWRFTADTTGGTAKFKNSLQCVSHYHPSTGTSKASTAIGERKDGTIEGTDVVVPAQRRTYSVRFARGVIIEAWFDYLEAITGYTNSTVWHGRPIGEVLFLGAKGSSGLNYAAECDVAFDFIFAKNVANKTFGVSGVDEVTGVSYKGHEIVDVIFEEGETASEPGHKIEQIRIHRVHEALNFYLYLGF